VLNQAKGISEAGTQLYPDEQLEPEESLFPGLGDLPLTAPTYIQIVAGASSSTGNIGFTAPAAISLTTEGVSSANFADTAPTQIQLNSSNATSTANISYTSPALLVLEKAFSSSTSAMRLVPFIAGDADISISLLYTSESTVEIAYDAEAIVSLVWMSLFTKEIL
jgi:hypothetical protein